MKESEGGVKESEMLRLQNNGAHSALERRI